MKKILLTILSIVCTLSMALAIVGCGPTDNGNNDDNGDKTQHTHTYSATYSSDETYHWLSATCEHTDLVDKKGEHTYGEAVLNEDGSLLVCTCDVCGKTKTEEVIVENPYFGFGGKLDLNYTDKYWEVEERYILELLAGLSDEGINIDFMGIGEGDKADFTLFVRDSVIYLGKGTEEIEIADLSELQGELGKFDFSIVDIKSIIEEAFSNLNASTAVVGVAASALQSEAVINLVKALVIGGYNYIYTESNVVDGNTVTTYDIHKTVDNFLLKVKEVSKYLDVNTETATIKSLYNSEAFKTLVDPLFREINAKDIESILTISKALVESVNGPVFPIEIIEAGELSAYEYIGKYLDVEITIGEEEVKFGDMLVKDLLYYLTSSAESDFTFEELIERIVMYVDQILPTAEISIITEGASAELGKLLGINFAIEVISFNEYDYTSTETSFSYGVEFEYDGEYINGYSSSINIKTIDGNNEEYTQEISMSLLPTENGYEFKVIDRDSTGYSTVVVCNVNLYIDDDGDFEKFEVIAEVKENNIKVLDLNASLSMTYAGEYKHITSIVNDIDYNVYFLNGQKDISYNYDDSIVFTYEDDLLTKIVISTKDEVTTHPFEGMLDGEYVDRCLETYVTSGEITLLCTYENELLTTAVIRIAEIDYLTIEIAYVENTDMVSSIKASLPNDYAVAEIKFEYTTELELSKVELIVDVVLAGEMGEDGVAIVEPYNAQFKVSLAPVYENDEVVGITGELYIDNRDETIDGTYELTVYDEELEFVKLDEIDGIHLTLEEVMDMFGFGATDGPAYACNHDEDVYYEAIDGEYHYGTCWNCDYEVIEEHAWEDYYGECYCDKCGAAQSDYE